MTLKVQHIYWGNGKKNKNKMASDLNFPLENFNWI